MGELLERSDEEMHVRNVFGEEWIILDSSSVVSLRPARFSVDNGTAASHSLQTQNTWHEIADLQVRDVGDEVLLPHEFVVGAVTTGLVSLGQLYQAG